MRTGFVTVAGIRGNSASGARTRASTPSANLGRGTRMYLGSRSHANAARTVFGEIPIRGAIALIDTPSARRSQRI
jgi:hypothetical protein